MSFSAHDCQKWVSLFAIGVAIRFLEEEVGIGCDGSKAGGKIRSHHHQSSASSLIVIYLFVCGNSISSFLTN